MEAECSHDGACGEGEICDVDLGLCVMARFVQPGDIPGGPGGDGGVGDGGAGDGGAGDGGGGDGGVGDGGIGDGGVGDGGVGDGGIGDGGIGDGGIGDGGIGDGGIGDGNGSGNCESAGDTCDPAELEQPGFLCVEGGDGAGYCLPRCDRSGYADSCDPGSYCWSVDGASTAACFPSMCNTHADCGSDTCVQLDNSYGSCLEAGPLGPGASCVTGGTNPRCQQGYFCSAPTGQTGECAPVCDPFASSPCADPINEACTVRWRRSGVCTTYPHLADTLTIYEECSSAGDWCTDAVQCMNVGSQGSFCMPYCRPGTNDCAGISLGGDPTICDNYWFMGEPAVGICWPPCQNDTECGDGWDCVQDLCRRPCTTGNPVTDCCGGSADCNAICDATGYCS